MERLTLPDAPWRSRDGLSALCDVLDASAGETRFVGGAVRDTLLGLDVADVDLATRHAPSEVLALLRGAGIKAVPTGLAHGTVTAVLPDGPIEVTTLRRDVATDGRHATVAFTDDWRADGARRDFTINALYADPESGEVFDDFGGRDDLAARRVRFIGDPLRRIAEDHLRILRFFRFHARFGDAPDAASLAACAERANDLMALSRERIAAELLKLTLAPRAVETLALMVAHDILAPVLPEVTATGVDRLARLALREADVGVPADPIRRLAALLPPDPIVGDSVGARLKLSNLQRKRLASALDEAMEAPRPLAYRLGREAALDRWLLSGASTDGASEIAAWTTPRFPLTGGAMVARGLVKGPDVARLLRQVENAWVAEGFPASARVEELADAAIAAFRAQMF